MILPSHFEDYTRQLMGPSLYEKLIEGLQQDAYGLILLNSLKLHKSQTITPLFIQLHVYLGAKTD